MKLLLRTVLLAVLGVSTVNAVPPELATSTNGSGTVQIGNSGDRVSKANIILKRDGTFSIGFVGGSDTRFSGTWQPTGRDTAALRLTGADGRSARGSGAIDFRGGRGNYEVERFSLSGENERGRSISVRFSGPRYVPAPPPPPPPRVVLDSERNGIGRLQVGGQKSYRISRVHIQLLPSGRAHVHVEGTAALRYEGTWSRAGETTANLEVRGGLDNERLVGIVRFRGDRFWQLNLSGTRAGRYHTLEFEAGR